MYTYEELNDIYYILGIFYHNKAKEKKILSVPGPWGEWWHGETVTVDNKNKTQQKTWWKFQAFSSLHQEDIKHSQRYWLEITANTKYCFHKSSVKF